MLHKDPVLAPKVGPENVRTLAVELHNSRTLDRARQCAPYAALPTSASVLDTRARHLELKICSGVHKGSGATNEKILKPKPPCMDFSNLLLSDRPTAA